MDRITLRNLSRVRYAGNDPDSPGGRLEIGPGGTGETSPDNAMRLIDDYPGRFEVVGAEVSPRPAAEPPEVPEPQHTAPATMNDGGAEPGAPSGELATGVGPAPPRRRGRPRKGV